MASGGAVDRLKDHHGTENDEHRTRDRRMSNLCLIKAADLLRKHGGKHSMIHYAAAGGDTEAVKELLAAGTMWIPSAR